MSSSGSDPSLTPAIRPPGEPIGAQVAPQLNTASLAAGLYIVSTPIGNLRDITLRALDVLAAADEVLAEDTRQTRRLLDAYGLKAKLTAYHDHNGAARRPELIEKLQAGGRIALVSDAGTPLVSDPGWKLVSEAIEAGVDIVPIPGASAMLAGLVASGLPSDRFLFAGFLPAKSGARISTLNALAEIPSTLIFYESGPRLPACLADMTACLGGDRDAVVARELTKLFEETRRADLKGLAAHYADVGPPKGEIVVLIGPPSLKTLSQDDIDAALRDALGRLPTKAAANEVAAALSLNKRDCYQRALALKNG
ncbi:MAG: 16S rRNA (cytidine(1402)-2'-O)-methyltransferase [Pseudomonadota bacterium]